MLQSKREIVALLYGFIVAISIPVVEWSLTWMAFVGQGRKFNQKFAADYQYHQ